MGWPAILTVRKYKLPDLLKSSHSGQKYGPQRLFIPHSLIFYYNISLYSKCGGCRTPTKSGYTAINYFACSLFKYLNV
jgi:hypothetical protein